MRAPLKTALANWAPSINIIIIIIITVISERERSTQVILVTVKRATKASNLFCNIAAKRVLKRVLRVLPNTFKPVSQQVRLLQVA